MLAEQSATQALLPSLCCRAGVPLAAEAATVRGRGSAQRVARVFWTLHGVLFFLITGRGRSHWCGCA